MSLDPSLLLDRRVVVAFVLQISGYAALLAVYPPSEPSGVVELLQGLPPLLLVLVAILALPALVPTFLLGVALSLVGLSPGSLPPLLLARGDVLFVAFAYLIAVAGVWARRRSVARADRHDHGA